MRHPTLAIVLMMTGLVLAGCTSNTTTTTTSSTPTSTTTTTSPTTMTTPTLPLTTAGITKVYVLAAPDRVAPGSQAEVCWRVEGTGKIPHTAIHFDSVSHPNSTSFLDYAGGAVYPGGALVPDPLGYTLPNVFCAKITANSNTYFRAHALFPTAAQSVLSDEHAVWAKAAPSGIDFVGDIPELAYAGTNVTACWQTDALGTIPHTAIHWDTVSHPNSTAFSDYAGGALYPDNTTAAATYATPGPFCTNVMMPATGAIFFRAHELGATGSGVNNLSAEKSITVGRAVSVYHVPPVAPSGKFTVCWRAEGSGPIPHTAIHWDNVSHPNSTAFGDYAGGAVYADNGTVAAATLPGPFCTAVPVPTSGSVFFRAHALNLPTGRNELSAESEIGAS